MPTCPRCGYPANQKTYDDVSGEYREYAIDHPPGLVQVYECESPMRENPDRWCFTVLDIHTGELIRWHKTFLIPIQELCSR